MDKKVFKIFVCAVLLYLIIGEIFLPRESEKVTGIFEELPVEWNWIKEDGSREPIEIPGSYDVERNDIMHIQAQLPEELQQNTYLRFYCLRQDVQVYIDGELRKEYSTKDTRLFGRTSSAYFLFVELKPEDAGKEITIYVQSDSNYSGVLRAVYYGDKLGLWSSAFRDSGLEFLIAVVTMLLGLGFLLGCVVLRNMYKIPLHLEYLCWCVIIVALWIIGNSEFRQLVFPNLSVASDITFIMVALIPMAFLIYLNGLQQKRYKEAYLIVETLVSVIFVFCVFLNMARIKDFSETISLIAVGGAVTICLILVTVGIDLRKGYVKKYMFPAIGMLFYCFCAALQFLAYFLRREDAFSGAVLSIGLLILLLLSAVHHILEMIHLEQEKQQAVLASETRTKFLARMSHEIRTPINAVLGMDEMILRESKEPEIRAYAADIQNAGKSLLSIINDILDFSKMDSGKLEIIPVEYQLSALLHNCYNMVIQRAEEKKLKLIVVNDPDMPKTLLGDEIRLNQIVVNLLTNAVKYSESGTIFLTADWERIDDSRINLKIAVRDEGIGIKEEDIPRLFDSFQRVDETKNRGIEGTGLGLAVTKQLVELMGGRISVESQYQKGSLFSVAIPQEISSWEPMGVFQPGNQPVAEPAAEDSGLWAPEAHILVVDDVQMNLKVVTGLLRPTGILVDTAISGAECLKLICRKKYDIIFLDHMMPEMDGMETLSEMKVSADNWNQNTPVIMLTANAIVGAKEEYLEAGFVDYLAKPVQGKVLEEIIRKYLPAEKIQEKII